MEFIDTLPSLADFHKELPYPNTIAEAYWVAELACICHARLRDSEPNGFWELLDKQDAKRLKHFLLDARNGVSKAANELQMLAEPEPVPFGNCDDVCDTTTDAIRCINARLLRLEKQIYSASRDGLQLALEQALGEAEVESIDDEDNRVDPNEPPPGNDLQVMAGSQIQHRPEVEEDTAAARFIGWPVAELRSFAYRMGVGVRVTGKRGRTATYLGDHPDPDYGGEIWWRIAEPATEEVG